MPNDFQRFQTDCRNREAQRIHDLNQQMFRQFQDNSHRSHQQFMDNMQAQQSARVQADSRQRHLMHQAAMAQQQQGEGYWRHRRQPSPVATKGEVVAFIVAAILAILAIIIVAGNWPAHSQPRPVHHVPHHAVHQMIPPHRAV